MSLMSLNSRLPERMLLDIFNERVVFKLYMDSERSVCHLVVLALRQVSLSIFFVVRQLILQSLLMWLRMGNLPRMRD